MSTTKSAKSDKLDIAVKKMIPHQSLIVKEAMQLDNFTAAKIDNKNMQRKVLWRLPGMGKCKMKAIAPEGGGYNHD